MNHVLADEPAGLAVSPAFAAPLLVGRPNIGSRDRLFERIGAALDRGWLSNGGPLAREFEVRVAQIAGTRHCVATCNATSALQLAIRASGLTGEIIVPALTFAATAHAVSWIGLTPVFCDVDRRTGLADPRHVESLIGPNTSAILAVHLWGRAAPVAALQQIATRHGLRLFFDAAHAFAGTSGGRPIGGFGDGEVFSFHSTKFVNAFEGGALVTNDDELAQTAISLRNFGITGVDEVSHVGINAKMSEASAAMGLTSLDSMADFVAHNIANYHGYRAGLRGLPGIRLLPVDTREQSNYQYVIVEVDRAGAGIDRDQLLTVLHAQNVMARRYFYPGCHEMAPYRGAVRLPRTEALAAGVIALPTGTSVSQQDVATICGLIGAALPGPVMATAARRPAPARARVSRLVSAPAVRELTAHPIGVE